MTFSSTQKEQQNNRIQQLFGILPDEEKQSSPTIDVSKTQDLLQRLNAFTEMIQISESQPQSMQPSMDIQIEQIISDDSSAEEMNDTDFDSEEDSDEEEEEEVEMEGQREKKEIVMNIEVGLFDVLNENAFADVPQYEIPVQDEKEKEKDIKHLLKQINKEKNIKKKLRLN